MVFDGGTVSDVVISNLTIECTRRDWFWWGDGDPIHFNVKRRCEIDPRLDTQKEPPAGSIRNVLIRNVIARGTGTCGIEGHPASPLENVVIDGLSLDLSCDRSAPYDKSNHALAIRHARNLTLRNVSVTWDAPEAEQWKSALFVESARDLAVEGFRGRQARAGGAAGAISLRDVEGAFVRGCTALAGTETFLHVSGARSRDVQLFANDLRQARTPSAADPEVRRDAISSVFDLLRKE
jgi:hypothetical protein